MFTEVVREVQPTPNPKLVCLVCCRGPQHACLRSPEDLKLEARDWACAEPLVSHAPTPNDSFHARTALPRPARSPADVAQRLGARRGVKREGVSPHRRRRRRRTARNTEARVGGHIRAARRLAPVGWPSVVPCPLLVLRRPWALVRARARLVPALVRGVVVWDVPARAILGLRGHALVGRGVGAAGVVGEDGVEPLDAFAGDVLDGVGGFVWDHAVELALLDVVQDAPAHLGLVVHAVKVLVVEVEERRVVERPGRVVPLIPLLSAQQPSLLLLSHAALALSRTLAVLRSARPLPVHFPVRSLHGAPPGLPQPSRDLCRVFS
mmetsp:Transcript_54517/g.128670  ORF Transcript_54517/g.128670 Transcript_54517/m.128670 type:complete len:322 (-) Transcript_54517:138-1103(-)